jgi:hypothetical protein
MAACDRVAETAPTAEATVVAPAALPPVDEDGRPLVTAHRLGVIGEVETVILLPHRITLEARIDTGANTNSIDARNIESFERDGKRWARFELVDRASDERVQIERPVTRDVRIKGDHGDGQRLVVTLKFAMGNEVFDQEFTLNDRTTMTYPVLIGRNGLDGIAVVDVARKHVLTTVVEREQ